MAITIILKLNQLDDRIQYDTYLVQLFGIDGLKINNIPTCINVFDPICMGKSLQFVMPSSLKDNIIKSNLEVLGTL